MSVAAVKARLAEIEEGITGVKRAYAQAPLSLPASDLPAFVNFAGQATHDWRLAGSDTDRETRLYLLRLYIAPLTTGTPGEIERRCEPFLESVRDVFAARPSLGRLRGVQTANLLGDGGPAVHQYGGERYIGDEFRLQARGRTGGGGLGAVRVIALDAAR